MSTRYKTVGAAPRVAARNRVVVSAAFAAFAAMSGTLGAQQAVTSFTREDGVAFQNPAPKRQGFSLFAEEDLAGTSLRLTGLYRYAFFNAGGLCTFGNTRGDIFNSSCGQFNGSSTYFHISSGVLPKAPVNAASGSLPAA